MGPIGLSTIAVPVDASLMWVLLRWLYLLVSLMFVVFGLVVITQVKQMNAAFKRRFNVVIKFLAIGYFILTLLVFWLTWVVLK